MDTVHMDRTIKIRNCQKLLHSTLIKWHTTLSLSLADNKAFSQHLAQKLEVKRNDEQLASQSSPSRSLCCVPSTRVAATASSSMANAWCSLCRVRGHIPDEWYLTRLATLPALVLSYCLQDSLVVAIGVSVKFSPPIFGFFWFLCQALIDNLFQTSCNIAALKHARLCGGREPEQRTGTKNDGVGAGPGWPPPLLTAPAASPAASSLQDDC